MRLVKLPDGIREGKYIYINPDNVTYVYEREDGTYIVTNDTESEDCGYRVLMPIEEVCGRLELGNRMYELGRELVEKADNSKDGDST